MKTPLILTIVEPAKFLQSPNGLIHTNLYTPSQMKLGNSLDKLMSVGINGS